jgi:RNA ligase (TIGR02306 family)
MSTIETKVITISDIKPHPNGEFLDIICVNGEGGFECVVKKGQFKIGDLAIYIMPDSVISDDMAKILIERNKIQIKNNRIKPINIRGVWSEGLCLVPNEWVNHLIKEGDDLTKELGITKYEPPPPPNQKSMLRSGKGINFNYINENFKTYYCVEKFKKYPKILSELGQDIVITKKIHGTNARYGIVTKPNYKKTLFNTIKSWFVKEETQEFLVGSHDKIKKPTANAIKFDDYYKTDTWWKVAKKYNLEDIVNKIADFEYLASFIDSTISKKSNAKRPDVIIYGEIFGEGVQKNYFYGFKNGELGFEVFDIMIDGKFCDWDKVISICKTFNLKVVDEIYRGTWNLELTKMALDIDVYDGIKHNREGIVIRPLKEIWHPKCGRVLLKFINPVFETDKKNTEYH